MSAQDRVLAVLAVARRLADAGDPLGVEARKVLDASSGLSPAGARLALERHVEREASPRDLDALIAWAGEADRCHVVLSANVCTAVVRALALALACAPEVHVRPSRRDPGLSGVFLDALERSPELARAGGRVERVADVSARAGDVVHAYGRDESLAAIRAALPDGVRFRGHGAGFGLAVIEAGDPLEEAARALADDVVPFDQRGCLSPRVALVGGGVEVGDRFARSLSTALEERGREVPRGPIDAGTRAELARYVALLEAVGMALRGAHHVVGLDLAPIRLELPPAVRAVHLAGVDPRDVPSLLRGLARAVTTIGLARSSADPGPIGRAVIACAPKARLARLGTLQRPPLDGPVDLRGG